MAELEELESKLGDLEALVAQALEIAQQHGALHTEAGTDPAILKQRQIIGYAAIAAASGALTLGTSNADVAGCTLTLPHVGVYNIDAVFDFHFDTLPDSTGATLAIGVLTDSSDVEVDTPRAALLGVHTLVNNEDARSTAPQQWIVTTTSKDTVFKLRARKSRTVVTEVVLAQSPHTTIRALYIGRASA